MDERVEVLELKPSRNGKALAMVKIRTCGLEIHGVKVIQGSRGLFVGLPSYPEKDPETGQTQWSPCVVLSTDLRSYVSDTVLNEWKEFVSAESRKAPEKADGGPPF